METKKRLNDDRRLFHVYQYLVNREKPITYYNILNLIQKFELLLLCFTFQQKF